jgi:hypothetical protein
MSGYTTTPNYGLLKPTVDADDDQWGTHLNQDMDILDTQLKSVANSVPTGGPFLSTAGGTMTGAVALAGVSTAPLAPPGNNTSQIASTAFVTAAVPAASSTVPIMDGTGVVGTGTTWARADHVHPSDTSLLARAGGTMTGALVLAADPAANMNPVTLQYYNAHTPVGAWILNNANTGGRAGLDIAVPALAAAGALLLGNFGAIDTPNVVWNVYYDSGASTWRNRSGGGGWMISPGGANILSISSVANGAADSAAAATYRMGVRNNGGVEIPYFLGTGAGATVASDAQPGTIRVGGALTLLTDQVQSLVGQFASNAYQTNAGVWKYLNAGMATVVSHAANAGSWTWYNAPSGSAGGTIALTNRMSLSALGSLYVPGSMAAGYVLPAAATGSLLIAANYAMNAYYDGSNWRYVNNGAAALIWLGAAGQIYFQNVGSAGAGATITWGNAAIYDVNGGFTAPALVGTNTITGGFVRSTGNIMCDNGMFYIGNNYNYYLGRSSSDGAWRFVENGTVNFTVQTDGTVFPRGALVTQGNNQIKPGNTGWGLYVEAGSGNYLQVFTSNYYWVWVPANGNLAYTLGGNQIWVMRNDSLAYNSWGTVGGNGAYQNISDERQKRDIVPATRGLPEILNVNPIRFKRNGPKLPDRDEIGFSAQQLREVIPEAVFVAGITLADGSGSMDSDEPSLSVALDPIVAALVNAMKELNARLMALEGAHA